MSMIEFLGVLSAIGTGLCLLVLLLLYLRSAQTDSAGLKERLQSGL